jgi:Flp pilus assembly protein TadD
MAQLARTALAAVAAVALTVIALGTSRSFADPTDENPAEGQLDPDYAAGRKAIDAKDWGAAVGFLGKAALRDSRNADIQNYLGYAYRNAGQLDRAFEHYRKALSLNPRHRGAHEYIGEAYLMVNDPAKAAEHLAALEKICVLPCEEYEDLKAKLTAYGARKGK